MALVQEPPVDIDVNGLAVRIVVDHADGAVKLRKAFEPYLTDTPGEFGFVVEAPGPDQKLFRLVDRTGIALARSRNAEHVLASVAGHVASLVAAPSPAVVRLRSRAIVNDRGEVTLLAPPIGMVPPLIERRLERSGYSILDQTVLSLTSDLAVQPVAALGPFSDAGPAHVTHWAEPMKVTRVLVPAGTGLEGSPAWAAAMLANAMLGSREAVFNAAVAIGERCALEPVDTMVRGSLYNVLG